MNLRDDGQVGRRSHNRHRIVTFGTIKLRGNPKSTSQACSGPRPSSGCSKTAARSCPVEIWQVLQSHGRHDPKMNVQVTTHDLADRNRIDRPDRGQYKAKASEHKALAE